MTVDACDVRLPRVSATAIVLIARKEIRDALRNRWFILYSAAFAVLATALCLLSLAGTETFGVAGYGRTAASLINLVILFVPLMGMTAGAGAIAPERESRTLAYLLAQPVTRLEVLAGKYAGLAVTLLGALAIGFGASALVAARRQVEPGTFAAIVGLAGLLALSMLGVGMLVSTLARKAGAALGTVIFLWLALVFLGDLGLMGSAIALKLEPPQLLGLALINPLQVFKLAAVGSIHASLDVLGPAGLYASQHYGAALPWVLGGVAALWIAVPPAAALLVFRRRGDA